MQKNMDGHNKAKRISVNYAARSGTRLVETLLKNKVDKNIITKL